MKENTNFVIKNHSYYTFLAQLIVIIEIYIILFYFCELCKYSETHMMK